MTFFQQSQAPSQGISYHSLTPKTMIQSEMLIEEPLIDSRLPTPRMCARKFQVPIDLRMLLFKVID
jgi:hypothetical protein